MYSPKNQGEVVFHTPWFQVLSRKMTEHEPPHYFIKTVDFVIIVALNEQGHLLLVRQFRQAINQFTLELPAGHIEPGEAPEEAARKELCEETGYEATTLELLGKHSPSTARFTNRMWIYFAPRIRLSPQPACPREAGVEALFYPGSIRSLVDNREFFASGAYSALFAAAAKGKIPF